MTIYVPVSVEDRLPETNICVHVLCDDNIARSAYVDMDGRWYNRTSHQLFGITHWLEERMISDDVLSIANAATSWHESSEDKDQREGFCAGANHIINIIKGKK